MHNARPQRPAHRRQPSEVVQQRIHQRAPVNARARVYHHAGWFINRHQVVVLVEHRQGNRFRRRLQRRTLDHFHCHRLPSAQPHAGACRLCLVHTYPPVADQLLDAGSAGGGKMSGQVDVQALAAHLRRHGKPPDFGRHG